MFKISSLMHGTSDYILVVLLFLSPTFFSMPPLTSRCTYILGGIHLLLTILTDFEAGLIKFIPFSIHGKIELMVSGALVATAFILENYEGVAAKNFYLSVAVIVFTTWVLTNYKEHA